ncbi:DNA-binding transcriptional regulator, LysR family [Roseateles sp. YR242]|uniref:LysR family transcriptional regulator n=1 Tax=Roseateles sp. YR242 TaxID=1855305 RepID=UPI0008D09CC1|nr:LysR family transcriptional regulator [Roseateles sp. YR242]SEK62174.1 DNA-binding transcriptional regulator, LysR family [Roseateles sp. YR242]
MDKLRAMEVLVSVAEKGSFTAAAEALDLSPVMVGKYIQALEAQLGGRLLERTTRRQRLTELGAAYLERSREVLSSVRAADSVAESLQAEPHGTLRITAPVSYGAARLAPVLADYVARYPHVDLDLNLNDRVVELAEEGFDCGIRMGPTHDDSLIARPLAASHMWVAASPAWVKRHGRPRHPSELEGQALLGFSAWGRSHAWRFTRGTETVQVPVRGPFATNNGQALLAAAVAGMGVVVQADVLLAPALAAGRLVPLLPGWALPSRAVAIVRLGERRPSAKLRSFVDFVVERLGDAPQRQPPRS